MSKDENWKTMVCVREKCTETFMANFNSISKTFPFCSMKCKALDLGMFLSLAEEAEEIEENSDETEECYD